LTGRVVASFTFPATPGRLPGGKVRIMNAKWWMSRVPDSLRLAHECATEVIGCYIDARIAAEQYQRAEGAMAEQKAREFAHCIFEMQQAHRRLNDSLLLVGHAFIAVAGNVQEVEGLPAASSTHELIVYLGYGASSSVASAIIEEVSPGYFRPGIETVVPDIPSENAILPYIGTAIASFAENATVPYEELNRLHSRLDQELVRAANLPVVAAIPSSDSSGPSATPEGQEVPEPRRGPVPPDGFEWDGVKRRGLTGVPWRLVDFLWSKRGHVAAFDDLAGPVWQDAEGFVTSDMAGSARSDANRFFTKNALPIKLTIKNKTFIELIVEDSKPARSPQSL